MTTNLAEQVDQEARAKKPLFVYAGGLHGVGIELVRDLRDRLGWKVIAIGDVAPEGPPINGRVVVADLESVLITDDPPRVLGTLRATLQERGPEIAAMVLISRVPRSRLMLGWASHLVADAPRFVIPLASKQACSELAESLGVSIAGAAKIGRSASGSLRIARAMGRATVEGQDGGAMAASVQAILDEALQELGPDLVATLDYFANECEVARLPVNELDQLDVEALVGGGIAILDEGHETLTCFGSKYLQTQWRRAIRAYVDRLVEAPRSWRETCGRLFQLERLLRAFVKSELRAAHGEGWKAFSIPTGMDAGAILDKANRDVPKSVRQIADIPNPLDYLTLPELLTVGGSRPLLERHLAPPHFQMLSSDVVGVRNRVLHMRLLRSGDADIVTKCLRTVQLRLRTSPPT